jgi:hypothetical protein
MATMTREALMGTLFAALTPAEAEASLRSVLAIAELPDKPAYDPSEVLTASLLVLEMAGQDYQAALDARPADVEVTEEELAAFLPLIEAMAGGAAS